LYTIQYKTVLIIFHLILQTFIIAQMTPTGGEGRIVGCWKCGPMPNVMAALSNIGGALCSTPQSLADAQY